MSIYALILDNPVPLAPNLFTMGKPKLHQQIDDNPAITDWWHYLPHLYLLITDLSKKEIRDLVKDCEPNRRHLILDVKLSASTGWLPKDAWTWLNENGRKQSSE